MVDRENVIKGLTAHRNGNCNERDCPWYYDDKDGCLVNLLDATLELLKEQSAQIAHLEYDLAITTNNLNYYINGND